MAVKMYRCLPLRSLPTCRELLPVCFFAFEAQERLETTKTWGLRTGDNDDRGVTVLFRETHIPSLSP